MVGRVNPNQNIMNLEDGVQIFLMTTKMKGESKMPAADNSQLL